MSLSKPESPIASAALLDSQSSNKRARTEINDDEIGQWKLYYWPNAVGRGEFARLLFAETETPYTNELKDGFDITELRKQLDHEFFALPVVQHITPNNQSVVLAQTAVQCRYIAEKCDSGRLLPSDPIDQALAAEIVATVTDVVEDGCKAWHTIDYNGSYESQKEETQPFIDYYINKRLPKFFDHFERRLVKAGGQYFVVNDLCYADLFVFHWLDGIKFQCPKQYNESNIPTLRKFYDRVASLPRIKARLETRDVEFTNTGPTF